MDIDWKFYQYTMKYCDTFYSQGRENVEMAAINLDMNSTSFIWCEKSTAIVV